MNHPRESSMTGTKLEVSIIIPVKNEALNIPSLADELTTVMSLQPWSWECIWVDDGSTDGTLPILEELSARVPRHRYLSFELGCGQSAAYWAGFREARGAVIATIDGDGQNDPSDIPKVVEMVTSGQVDMANGYRRKRQDSIVRIIASRVANTFRNLTTGKTVRDVGCSTRAFRRECVICLPMFAGAHRFLPTLVTMQGFTLGETAVNHRPRMKGESKYTINNRLWVGLFDTCGVFWLRKRAFRYTVARKSREDRR